MHGEVSGPAGTPGYSIAIVTLDAHAAGPAARIAPRLQQDFPGLTLSIHAAAEWAEKPEALAAAREAIGRADIVIANLLFIEEHINAVLPELQAARERVDAFVGMIADPSIVKLTKMGDLDMQKPASGPMALLKKLRGASKEQGNSGESQMRMLRTIPKMLKFVPGKAQDLRAWFLSMQYWLGGSDDNLEQMVRYLVSRYSANRAWHRIHAKAPIEYPEVGLYHPSLPDRITTDPNDLPAPRAPRSRWAS